ncbi:MAG: MFS transporter, partial [Gemmiger sp.]
MELDLKKQLHRLYGYGFASCLRITTSVWVALLALRGFTMWQVGMAEGLFHAVSLICEVPSGVAADLLGRRRTLALSGVIGALSSLAMIAGNSFGWVCLSMAFSALSYNLISGTQEAITYDSLVAVGRQDDYLQVDANITQLQQLGGVFSDLCSMLAGVLSYVGFYLLDAVTALVRTLLALSLKEPVVTRTQAERQRNPFAGLGERLRQHVRTAATFLRSNPQAARLIFANALICLPGYLTLMFLQQRLTELGLPVMLLGLPLLALELCPMLGTAVGRRLKTPRLRPLF